MEFSRQEYWSWFPFPPSRNPPHPGIESTFPASCILAGGSWENCLKHSRSSNHRFSDLTACDGWKETGKIFLGTYLSGLMAYKIIIYRDFPLTNCHICKTAKSHLALKKLINLKYSEQKYEN